jgi:hypothetical protein
MAENALELLKMADEGIPEGTGYRGHRRKKQQRIRLAIIRVRVTTVIRRRLCF